MLRNVLLWLLAFAAAAQIPASELPTCLQRRRLMTFGDSLSAYERYVNITNPNRYFNYERVSNGRVWPEYLENAVEVIYPFAWSGATAVQATSNDQGNPLTYLRGQLDEMARFLIERQLPPVQRSDCFAIWIGANDLAAKANNDDDPENDDMTDEEYAEILDNIVDAIYRLIVLSGGRCVFVLSLPELDRFPSQSGETAPLALFFSNEFDLRLARSIQGLRERLAGMGVPGRIMLVEMRRVFSAALDGPSPSGGPWRWDSCKPSTATFLEPYPCPDTFWWDRSHPATDGHNMLARGISAAMCRQMNSACITGGNRSLIQRTSSGNITYGSLSLNFTRLSGSELSIEATFAVTRGVLNGPLHLYISPVSPPTEPYGAASSQYKSANADGTQTYGFPSVMRLSCINSSTATSFFVSARAAAQATPSNTVELWAEWLDLVTTPDLDSDMFFVATVFCTCPLDVIPSFTEAVDEDFVPRAAQRPFRLPRWALVTIAATVGVAVGCLVCAGLLFALRRWRRARISFTDMKFDTALSSSLDPWESFPPSPTLLLPGDVKGYDVPSGFAVDIDSDFPACPSSRADSFSLPAPPVPAGLGAAL